MSSRKKRKRRKLKKWVRLFFCLFFISIVIGGGFLIFKKIDFKKVNVPFVKIENVYLASDTNVISLYSSKEDEDGKVILEKVKDVSRGIKVTKEKGTLSYEDVDYQKIGYDGKEYYIKKGFFVKDEKKVVLEKNVYVRTATSVIESVDDRKIVSLVKKGDDLEVLGYDSLDEEGNVHLYNVKVGDKSGYVYGKYMFYSKEESLKNYEASLYDAIHSKVQDSYGGGEAIKLDFYPNEKPSFEKNKMPDAVYALYLNAGVLGDVDSYIEFAKSTKINSFVVDIKDNETPAYPARTFEKLSPTNFEKSKTYNTYDEFKAAIQKLKDNGFYVIGRITTFKDSYYVKDHPEDAILNKYNNSPFLHNGSYWPSAYNRNVWYYTLSLARESALEFGFNEINFDYVRFPDRMNSVMSSLDLKNVYEEDKVEAIQRFVQYVTDGLHDIDVYASVDVFGESTNSSYTTAYGQYWPAISNVCDAISGMPYPDHFSAGSYGIQKPWNNPYLLMKYWGGYAMDRQKECPTPAKVRTWIQAYDVMRYVDANGINYNAKEVEQEIRGLYDAGAMDGYITWLSNSSLAKYRNQKGAFDIDYRKEYMDAKNNG